MMESSSSENIHPLEQLAMITDGGGVRVAMSHNPSAGPVLNLEHGLEHFESSRDGRSADLISTALDAANICEADGASSIHDQQAAAAEEGIIYRNPQNNTPATASSKVHFISNLTLIAKQQQNASRAGQNIIFLNNAGATATANNNSSHSTGKLTSAAAAAGTTTTNYINAFVSKGVATTAGGKVVNVLHSAPKAATPLVQQVRGKAAVPMLKRPPTQPPPRSLSVIGRSAGGKSHVTLQTQKPPHIVIGGTATSSSALSMKSLASGKLIAPGLYSSATVGGAAATMANTKVAYSVGNESQHHSVSKYGRGGVVQGKLKAAVPKYQVPKVVQVQQLHRNSPHHQSPSSLNYTQLRVDEPSLNVVHGHSPTKIPTTASPSSSPQVLHKSSIQFQPSLNSNGEHASKTLPGTRSTNSYMNMTSQAFGPSGHLVEEYTQGDAEGRATGTIKYVSAQGTVIQHVHTSIATTKPAAGVAAAQPSSEEVYYVNGTQMNDEMSARLLQNFSQKATRRYVAQLSVTNPTTHHNSPVTGGGHKNQYLASPLSAIGPEYVRVNDILQAATTTTAPSVLPNTNANMDGSQSVAGGNDNNNNGLCGAMGVGPSSHAGDGQAVEVRPAPISGTEERSNALQAVLQDHTYVLLRPPAAGDQKAEHDPNATTAHDAPSEAQQLQSYAISQLAASLDSKELGIAMALADVGGHRSAFHHHQQLQQPQPQQHRRMHQQPSSNNKCTTTDLLNAAMGLGHYSMSAAGAVDDDNCSVISTDSQSGRTPGENDLGEETETAPEGEGEDDSVTRCICDLTHDDGYMICCDKCSMWQHVDCMGIDRMNIPDEYKCEVCQPRPMDKNRARTLQLLKRREQQQNAVLMNSMAMANGGVMGEAGATFLAAGIPGADVLPSPLDDIPGVGGGGLDGYSRNKALIASPSKKAKPQLGARRKSDLSSSFSVKKQKRDLLKNGVASKRKEKKTLSKKRTTSGGLGGSGKQSMPLGQLPLGAAATEECKQGGKVWTDNYETAMTNHYSPELRARLQAISKQQLLLSPTGPKPPQVSLRNVDDLAGKCTTVPHAGGKILISTLDVAPGEPIVELRGKYMLSSQYRQHNPMPSNRNQAAKAAGPFIFFYRMVNDATEMCVDARTYGNDARFVRRSCRPNSELVHQLEKGTIHLYIVSLQLVRSSTEITIKHEPNDLLAVSRANAAGTGEVPRPTSTSCGCGLVKDCLFYNANSGGVSSPVIEGPRNGKQRPNGNAQKWRTNSTSRGSGADDNNQGPIRRSSKANLRNSRSTSSSGESSASMKSPNVVFGPIATDAADTTGPLSPKFNPDMNLHHPLHSNIKISGSPPIESGSAADMPIMVVKKEEKVAQEIKVESNLGPEPFPSSFAKHDAPPFMKSSSEMAKPVIVVKEEAIEPVHCSEALMSPCSEGVPRKEKEEQPTVQMETQENGGADKIIIEEGATEEAIMTLDSPSQALSLSAHKSAEQMASQKKNKELKSLNEENLKAAPVRGGSCEESRKLTREERKMEAIMKAFEKMEKSSMRKQEGRKSSGTPCGNDGGSSTPGKRQCGQSQRGGEDMSIFKKKKRKGSKCYQQANQRRIRRKSAAAIDNDDTFMSDDSNGSLLASPPIAVPFPYPTRPQYNHTEHSSSIVHGEQDSAANMLLSLANASPAGTAVAAASSPKIEVAGPLSAVYMLVEAAIAPLEAASDFKVPKTKKSIMNDWLTGETSPVPPSPTTQQPFESLIQAACSEITQPVCGGVEAGDGEGQADMQESALLVPSPFQTPPSTGGSESAVKKRWLRQAISEECSDEAPASPTNGYAATPLKKRRFAIHCAEMTDDPLRSPGVTPAHSIANSAGECVQAEPVMIITETMPCADDRAPEEVYTPVEAAPRTVESQAVHITHPPAVEMAEEPVSVPEPSPVMTPIDDIVEVVKEEEEMEKPHTEEPPCTMVAAQQQQEEKMQETNNTQSPQPVEMIIAEEEKVEPKVIIPEEFDIEPLNPEDKSGAEESVKIGSGEEGIDEIADIQKRLHSFHTQNILFLKSMNKKKKPNPSPLNSECPSEYSSASVSASSSGASSPISSPKSSISDKLMILGRNPSVAIKRKKLDFEMGGPTSSSAGGEDLAAAAVSKSPEETTCMEVRSPERWPKRRTKSRFSSPVITPIELLTDMNSNTVGMFKENTDSNVGEATTTFKSPERQHSYYTMGHQSSVGLGHPALLPSQMINTSIPPPRLSFAPMFNNAFGGPLEDSSVIAPQEASPSRLLLSELLENAQKMNHIQPLTEMSSSVASYSTVLGPGAAATASVTSFGGPSALLSLSNPATSLSKLSLNTESPNVVRNQATPGRTLIRTASADPRLNPNLNATPETPPAPKRKLSINEYRKRMQQTPSGSGEGSSLTSSPTASFSTREGGSGSKVGLEDEEGGDDEDSDEIVVKVAEFTSDPILDSLCDSSSCASPVNADGVQMVTEKGTFSAAPTLLERQQESISERLKSYKSVTELLTTKDGTPIITTILQNNPLGLGTSIIESLRTSISGGLTEEGVAEEDVDGGGGVGGGVEGETDRTTQQEATNATV